MQAVEKAIQDLKAAKGTQVKETIRQINVLAGCPKLTSSAVTIAVVEFLVDVALMWHHVPHIKIWSIIVKHCKLAVDLKRVLIYVAILKANMNSYIQLQTAAIFFLSSLYLKQGIDSVYVMVVFICKG